MPAQDAVTFKHHTIHSPARQLIPRILVNRRITGDLLIRDGIKIHFGTGKPNVKYFIYLVGKGSVVVQEYLHTVQRDIGYLYGNLPATDVPVVLSFDGHRQEERRFG